jgi:hypothetical protein
MAGRRLDADSIGESYEVFAESVLSRIATLTRIGTKQDFGTDTYCQPRVAIGERMEAVTELCLLQVNGGSSPLMYGGVDSAGQWKEYEFEWLKNLWAPLYLARVDPQYQRVDLFSLWPIWLVMWRCGTPFKIIFSVRDATESAYTFLQPTSEPTPSGAGMGDDHTWTIYLGPPLLRLTHQNLNDDNFRNQAVDIFRYWIQIDRQTVPRFHARVPFVEAILAWVTNQMPGAYQQVLVYDPRPGMNIDWLAKALVPSLLTLGVHLQRQGNSEAYRLISILEWIETSKYGNELTKRLLEELSRAKREGVSPATYLSVP